MATDTRVQFLDKAQALFAERGFYGTSIAAIAAELDLSKQALLHHFGSKEKLYAEVLARISESFAALEDNAAATDPADRFVEYMLSVQAYTQAEPAQTALLIRELLDNRRRADSAGTWYLKGFLEALIAMVQAIPNWRNASDPEALALAYQILGAINYFSISAPTLTGIFGARRYNELDRDFPRRLEAMTRAAVALRAQN